MHISKLIRSTGLAVLILVLPAGIPPAAPDAAESAEAPATAEAVVTDIKVSFKLDTRTTRALYMGERWVSPPTYSGVQTGKTFQVKVKAEGVDAAGKVTDISPAWTPEDPGMLEVSPNRGHQVELTVRRAGETGLAVAFRGFTKRLSIHAFYRDNAIRVEISPTAEADK